MANLKKCGYVLISENYIDLISGIEQKKEAATHQQDHQRWSPEKADQLAHDRFELFDRIHGP